MSDSVFETVEKSCQILKLDFSSVEFAKLAEEQDFSEKQIAAVGMVFEHLKEKKVETLRRKVKSLGSLLSTALKMYIPIF